MSPEGASPQMSEQPGQESPDAAGGMAQGLQALEQGTSALVEGLTQSGAPQEAVALAQQAAQAIAQLSQMMSGGSAAPSAQEQARV